MPELKPSRSWWEALRRIGVQNPGEIGVATPIQLTADVDDLSHLVPPVVVPVVAWAGFGPAPAAGNHSGIHLAVTAPGGCWVEDVGDFDGTWQMKTTRTAVATVTAAAVDVSEMTWPAEEPVQSPLLLESWIAANIFAGVNRRGDSGGRLQAMPFYLRPGDHLYVWDNTVATVWVGALTWREIPRGAFSVETT